MYTKKYHSVKLFLFGIILFASGVLTTVIATTLVDANIEARANTIWNVIKSNASKMEASDVISYYQLVRLNISSLSQVLDSVDAKIVQEASTIGLPTDTGIIGEITRPGTLPPKTTNPTPAPAPVVPPANPTPAPIPPVANNSCQVGAVTWAPGSTRCEGTTAMVCENKAWKANPNSTQCGWSTPTPAPTPTPGTNSNVGYLVTRQHAAEFCKIKFHNPAFTTINQNITKSVTPNCTSRCLISKFNWVLGGSIIYEDREDYWGRDGWIVDNIKCTSDTSTAPVDPANTYVKNKTQKCVESEKSYYWFDSNNQKTDLIQKCSTPPNGWLSCSERAGGCCPAWQVAINGKCVVPAEEWQACYATSGCKAWLSCNNSVCKATLSSAPTPAPTPTPTPTPAPTPVPTPTPIPQENSPKDAVCGTLAGQGIMRDTLNANTPNTCAVGKFIKTYQYNWGTQFEPYYDSLLENVGSMPTPLMSANYKYTCEWINGGKNAICQTGKIQENAVCGNSLNCASGVLKLTDEQDQYDSRKYKDGELNWECTWYSNGAMNAPTACKAEAFGQNPVCWSRFFQSSSAITSLGSITYQAGANEMHYEFNPDVVCDLPNWLTTRKADFVTPIDLDWTDGRFDWKCSGVDRFGKPSGETVTCWVTRIFPGECGTNNGTSLSKLDSDSAFYQSWGGPILLKYCKVGYPNYTDFAGADGSFNWTCDVNGAPKKECSATKAP